MAAPPPRSAQPAPPARPPKSSQDLSRPPKSSQAPLLDRKSSQTSLLDQKSSEAPAQDQKTPLLDPPTLPEAFRPGKGRTSTLTSPPPLFKTASETSTLRADEREPNLEKEGSSNSNKKKTSHLKKEQEDLVRSELHSPSPPPPPSLTSLGEQEEFPPPPSYSTLKRLTSYRR